MQCFLICKNPGCRFILDRRVNGTSLDGVQKILKTCPACGDDWSSSCPYCNQPLTVSFVDGLPCSACCGHKLRAETLAAQANRTGISVL
jgi:predicted amidophosphoribosyltransferase